MWLWRDDHKRWVIETMNTMIEFYVDHPELVYTYWCELVEPERPVE